MTADEATEMMRLVKETHTIVKNLEKRAATTIVKAAAASSTEVASDADLDGSHGNFIVKKDPKRWTGPSFVGCKLSECSAEFLDELAGFREWQAGMDDKKGTPEDDRKAGFSRRDAARCRGWAARIRAGYVPPEPEPVDESSVPF